jgi:ABC-type transporter lipoprotein component MlaA
MKSILIALIGFLPIFSMAFCSENAKDTTDKWHGFERTHFTFNGRNALVVKPVKPLEG